MKTILSDYETMHKELQQQVGAKFTPGLEIELKYRGKEYREQVQSKDFLSESISRGLSHVYILWDKKETDKC